MSLDEALRISEQRFRLLYEQSPFSIQIFSPDGFTIHLNKACEEMWATSREVVLNGKYNIFEDKQLEAKGLMPYVKRLFSGEPVSASAIYYDPAEIGRPGRPRWVESYGYPVKDAGGVLNEVVLLQQDVTERKLAEQKLSGDRFRYLIEQSPLSIHIFSPDGWTVLVNESWEKYWNMSRQELAERNYNILEDQQLEKTGCMPYILRGFAGEATRVPPVLYDPAQMGYPPREGWPRWVGAYIHPIKDDHGNVLEVAFVHEDIAESKRIEEALRKAYGEMEALVQQRTLELSKTNQALKAEISERKQAEAALGQQARELARSNADLEEFAFIVSHDLGGPVATIDRHLKLLKKRNKKKMDSECCKLMEETFIGIRYCRKLIKDLLTYSRVTRQGKGMRLVSCGRAFRAACRNLHAVIEKSRAKITCGSLPSVVAEEIQLVELFQNLIENAIKFRSRKPLQVEVGADQRDNSWTFTVRDNGIGIDPKYFKHIFSIFNRVHPEKKSSGTGIGLAICKKIVELHCGRIWVESKPGKGSIFCFTIPVR